MGGFGGLGKGGVWGDRMQANDRTGACKSSGETDGEAGTAVECAEDAEENGYAAGG